MAVPATLASLLLPSPVLLRPAGMSTGRAAKPEKRHLCFWGGGFCFGLFFAWLVDYPPAAFLFLHLLASSADMRSIAFFHHPIFIVCLAKDQVVLQEKLVSNAKPGRMRHLERRSVIFKHTALTYWWTTDGLLQIIHRWFTTDGCNMFTCITCITGSV